MDEVDLFHGPDVDFDLLLHGPNNNVDLVVGPDDEVDLLIGSDNEGNVVRSSSGPWTRSILPLGPTVMSTSSKAARMQIDLVIGSDDEVNLVTGSVDEVDLVIGSDNEVDLEVAHRHRILGKQRVEFLFSLRALFAQYFYFYLVCWRYNMT